MYYPYLRGKQFELLMLREMAPKIAQWGFTPVIEPVKKNFPVLKRALDELCNNNCNFVLIANPFVGDMSHDSSTLIDEIINNHLADYENFSIGIHLSSENTLDQANHLLNQFDRQVSIIHNGFSEGKKLSELIAEKNSDIQEHIFIEKQNSRLYRNHFAQSKRVLMEDGFISRKNREYPENELFSELYLTYKTDLGCQGFGDFLMVGSDFNEGGGPAYAIAIHLTYVDPDADNAIAIKHYVSDEVDTPKNPGGKYLQALKKLYNDVTAPGSLIFRSDAVEEYLQFYENNHFPGLGYTKKLSMQHHLELMAHVLIDEA